MTLIELEGLCKLAKTDRGAAMGLALQSDEILELIERYKNLFLILKVTFDKCNEVEPNPSEKKHIGAILRLIARYNPDVPLGEKK